jgi:hypothetical protein
MKPLIACCGLDCETCDARIATIADNNALREETAKKWRAMFDSPDITAASINCTGCRTDGAKFCHCRECEIRACVMGKGFATCGDCGELDSCATVAMILQGVPDARANLGR